MASLCTPQRQCATAGSRSTSSLVRTGVRPDPDAKIPGVVDELMDAVKPLPTSRNSRSSVPPRAPSTRSELLDAQPDLIDAPRGDVVNLLVGAVGPTRCTWQA